MEIYKSNRKNSTIYKKIDYLKLLIIIVVSFTLFSLFFYYIGRQQKLGDSILTSILVTLLISLGSIISDILENRVKVFLSDRKELGYIEIHNENFGGPFVSDREYQEVLKKYDIEEIYKDNSQYEGIDKGVIKKVLKIKKRFNKTVVKAEVDLKEWKSSSFISIVNLFIKEKTCIKKIIIPNDYDNYEKLYKKLSKLK